MNRKRQESYVYILTNFKRNVLYVGVTSNLEKRVYEHKSKQVSISVSNKHALVQLTDLLNWAALETIAEEIRESRGFQNAGKRTRYWQLLGAVTLMAVQNMTYREAEDQIAHYRPARYLCDLMDSDMTLDHVTIFEFTQMLGPEGMENINGQILKRAHSHELIDPSILMSDTTAQEAKVTYPNEEGLMKHYLEIVSRTASKLGGKFRKSLVSIAEDTARPMYQRLNHWE